MGAAYVMGATYSKGAAYVMWLHLHLGTAYVMAVHQLTRAHFGQHFG